VVEPALARLIVAPLIVRLPPSVVSPVPVVMAALLVVFKFNKLGLLMKILPVLVSPRVKDCLAVVANVPFAER